MEDTLGYHLVQLHRPDDGWGELQALAARVRVAVDEIATDGEPVRFLRSIFVPEDDTCFQLFEGAPAAVAEALTRAGLAAETVGSLA